jgi:hypothetical protein
MKKIIQSLATVTFMAICFAFSPHVQAVSPAPDSCYPNYTTAEGCNALNFLTTGIGNTAIGWYSLFVVNDGSFNTGVGAGALAINGAYDNTAVGAAAMLLNAIGTQNVAVGTNAILYNGSGSGNTAVGYQALFSNIDGHDNSAFGWGTLNFNTTGYANTAVGSGALFSNTEGYINVAVGDALSSNTVGHENTAVGFATLLFNTEGSWNTAIGEDALTNNTSGTFNTAIGLAALSENITGNGNIAVGADAGSNITTADNVICIGTDFAGADVSNTTWVANIYGVTTQSGTTAPVIVSDTGQLGTVASSERFKKDIATMEKASEAILSLRPVKFHYKSDTKGTPQFGLIAEEVAKINPALVLPDREGKPYTVRYDAVNAMLLNEFLKEHRRVQELKSAMVQQRKDFEAAIARQQKQTETLVARLNEQEARIQKVTAQVQDRKSASEMLAENQ